MSTRDEPTLPTTEIERDPAKLELALPWYQNGSLSDADREWVEAQLIEQQRTVPAIDLGIARALENRAQEVPPNVAWDGLLAKVRADSHSQASVANQPG